MGVIHLNCFLEPNLESLPKVTILSNIIVRPSASSLDTICQLNPQTSTPITGDNSEALQVATEILEVILFNVEKSALQLTLTKDGKPRKRRKYRQSLKERKENSTRKKQKLHSIKEGCSRDTCLKKCQEKIVTNQHILINREFWEMTNKDQRSFLLNCVSKTNIKRRTTAATTSRRSNTMTYAFKDKGGSRIEVCKTFFLNTLGFKRSNDKLIRSVFNKTDRNAIVPKTDGRGKPNNKKFDREVIVKHIESFNPSIAHYRREHAPRRRYLPSDITIKSMYEDFKEKHSTIKFSYYLYREVVSSLNISFSKLGHEECWACEVFSVHSKESGHQKDSLNLDCDGCITWNVHHERYKSARAEYQKDCAESEVIVTVDLQKVILI